MGAHTPRMTSPVQRSVSRKTVAHLIATNFYGGPEKQIVEHLKRLNPDKYRGIAVSFVEGVRENEFLQRATEAGLQTAGIAMSTPFDLRAWARLHRLLRSAEVDLLCVHGYKATVMGWWIQKTLGIPVLAFSRGYTTENPKVVLYEYLDRMVLSRVTGVVCVSEGQRCRLGALGVRPRESWVVHNAVSIRSPATDVPTIRSSLLQQLAIPADSTLVVCAGRLSPEKGHRDLLEAIALLRQQVDKAVFLICGDGPCRRELERSAQRLNISDHVRFAGFRNDLQDIFQIMDLLVLPSHTEGLPNVVLEALAWAKPVIATAVGGIPELIDNGLNGLTVPPHSPGALAEALTWCLSSPTETREMGEAGLSAARTGFSFDRQKQELETIYQAVLGARASSLHRRDSD